MSIKIASLALDLPKCRRIGFWEVETASGYANYYLHLGDRGTNFRSITHPLRRAVRWHGFTH